MLKHALELWTSLFANHAALRTGIDFLHVGALVGGGGFAVAADRSALVATRRGPAPERLELLDGGHRLVVIALVVIIGSGLLLFAADVDTFLPSRIFWLKMGLFGLLLINGAQMIRAERAAGQGDLRALRRLRSLAIASLALWFLTTLAGTALPNLS
jgi:uncharacterized membrane protein